MAPHQGNVLSQWIKQLVNFCFMIFNTLSSASAWLFLYLLIFLCLCLFSITFPFHELQITNSDSELLTSLSFVLLYWQMGWTGINSYWWGVNKSCFLFCFVILFMWRCILVLTLEEVRQLFTICMCENDSSPVLRADYEMNTFRFCFCIFLVCYF